MRAIGSRKVANNRIDNAPKAVALYGQFHGLPYFVAALMKSRHR